jgi:hypothetical protein
LIISAEQNQLKGDLWLGNLRAAQNKVSKDNSKITRSFYKKTIF